MNKDITNLKKVEPIPIKLYDATADNADNNQDEANNLWCVNCSINNPIIIEGTNLGKYTLWNIDFKTSTGNKVTVKKRYRDFEELYNVLKRKYSGKVLISHLPPKNSIFQNRFDVEFLEKRRKSLEYWLNNVVLNPVIGNCEEIKKFVLT